MKLILAPILASLILAGCATVPDIVPKALPVTPAAFKEGEGRWTTVRPADSQPRGDWWRAFADPVLDRLVERAAESNTSIAVAAARLAQARALLQSNVANQWPQLGLGASASRAGGTANQAQFPPGTLVTAGANLSYEIDLFGKLAKASLASELDAQAREALLQNTRLLVQADVAQAYFALRGLDEERALVRRTVSAYRETAALTERRFRAGDVAELEVLRAGTQVAATEAEAFALDRRRAELEHAIAVLVGEPASSFGLVETDWTTSLPVIPAGVPSTVLARRPDVAAAQRTVLASSVRIGVAEAAWFPDLSLTGAAGYASPEIGDLFKWSMRAWGVGALLALPIIDGGRRDAGVQFANAERDATLAQYRERVLVAFKDVEDQLSALRHLASQAAAQERAVASATRSTALSDVRYRNGYVSQLDLLDAQRSELANRRQSVQVRTAQYQATVGLVRALGGGWGQS
ncbi:MAG: efflux transporter outer membrane subunit [Burkholderiales bacterium]